MIFLFRLFICCPNVVPNTKFESLKVCYRMRKKMLMVVNGGGGGGVKNTEKNNISIDDIINYHLSFFTLSINFNQKKKNFPF